MRINSLKIFVSDFFEKNKEDLLRNYPGLTIRRLLRDFCDHFHLDENDHFYGEDSKEVQEILEGRPLEYIWQESFFYQHAFYVDPRVLIPRYETEILVEDSIHFLKKFNMTHAKIYEVGTGAGIIACSILANIGLPLCCGASDISSEALEVALKNKEQLMKYFHPQAELQFHLADRLSKAPSGLHFIVSNPPYIPETEGKAGVHHQVDNYEPRMALYLPDNEYYQWFEDFFRQASDKLVETGAFFLEGHEDCLEKLLEIALKYFKSGEIKNDYTGAKRFLYLFK